MFLCNIRLIPKVEMLTVTDSFVTVRKYHLVRLRASPQPCGKKFVTVQDEIRNRGQKSS